MILEKRPLTMAEARSYLKIPEGADKHPLDDYFKAFTKLSKEKAIELVDELRKLNNAKLKEEDLVKIVDCLPKETAEANKLFSEIALTEEEANSIVEIVKKH